MSNYVIDSSGKWLVEGNVRMLVEPSEEYLKYEAEYEKTEIEREENKPLTREQELELQIKQQGAVLEEILFDIIPMLMGGE